MKTQRGMGFMIYVFFAGLTMVMLIGGGSTVAKEVGSQVKSAIRQSSLSQFIDIDNAFSSSTKTKWYKDASISEFRNSPEAKFLGLGK